MTIACTTLDAIAYDCNFHTFKYMRSIAILRLLQYLLATEITVFASRAARSPSSEDRKGEVQMCYFRAHRSGI